jgi:hypothetical protein
MGMTSDGIILRHRTQSWMIRASSDLHNMDAITHYFNAERAESLLFVVVGVVAIALALLFWFSTKNPLANGAAWPLLALALIQIVVGASVYVRSPKDIQRVQQIVQREPHGVTQTEVARMQGVMKNFVIYRWIEIGLLLLSVVLILATPTASLWRGVGYGLLVQSGLMLALDFFAERRGAEYLAYLRSL